MKLNNYLFHFLFLTIFTMICSLKVVELVQDLNFNEKIVVCDLDNQDKMDQNMDFEQLGLLVTDVSFYAFYRSSSRNNYLPSFLDESYLIFDFFKPPKIYS